jgi:putative lipoic acid-binding regulatory protein
LHTVHGEVVEADYWYISVQPSGNAKGVKVSLRAYDFDQTGLLHRLKTE